MEKRYITIKEIWQDKLTRYAILSLIVPIMLTIVAPFFPQFRLLWIAVFVLFVVVFIILTWITTAREQKGA